jgi:hypothetical protein
MANEALINLMAAADEFDNAAQRMLTAQPFQMAAAAERLDAARLAFRQLMNGFAMNAGRSALAQESKPEPSP